MKKTLVCLIAIPFLSILVSCSLSGDRLRVYCVNGSVSVNGGDTFAGMALTEGDRIASAAKSFSVVQIGKRGFVLVYPNTSLRIPGKGESSDNIILENGALFVNISDGGFSVLLSDVIMKSKGVFRGVIFSTESVKSIHLAGGEIQLVRSGTGNPSEKPFSLKPGYYLDFIDGRVQSPIPLSETDIKEQLILDKVKAHSDGSIMSLDESVPKDAQLLLLGFDQKKVLDIAALKRLVMKYGPLSVVKTCSGRSIIGSVKIQGRIMEIETIDGTVRIPASDMKTSSRYGF